MKKQIVQKEALNGLGISWIFYAANELFKPNYICMHCIFYFLIMLIIDFVLQLSNFSQMHIVFRNDCV